MTSLGAVTVKRWTELLSQGVRVRVFVRGEDVTWRCQFVDDTPGSETAILLRKTPAGCSHIDEDGAVAVEVAHEDIEIKLEDA